MPISAPISSGIDIALPNTPELVKDSAVYGELVLIYRAIKTLQAALLNTLSVDITATNSLNATYTNGARAKLVAVTVRCIITLAAGTAYIQALSDTASPPTIPASGLVGIQAGLLNEDNTFQLVFVVAAGATYRVNSAVANGTVTLGKWFETEI